VSHPSSTEPPALIRGRALAAIARNGLAFTRDPYDRERFEQLQAIAAEMLAEGADHTPGEIGALLAAEAGYMTPKVDVRAAAFDALGRILMVRETADGGRWTLPGGWADPGQTASACAERELFEESGYTGRATKLALLHDRGTQGHTPPGLFSIYKLFFLCELTGGAAATSLETSEIGFFGEDAIPGELSLGRVLPHQIARLFAHRRDPSLPTEFDR